MDKIEIITQKQCDKLLKNCYKIGALSSALSELTEGEDHEAANLADIIGDYNVQSLQIIDDAYHVFAKAENKEAPENKPASQDSEA